MRLDVRVVSSEQSLGAVPGQILRHVYPFTPAIISFAGETLGVLVGEHGPESVQHRAGHEIFAGDQLELGRLTDGLVPNRLVQFGI